jgi:hypothetical protein
MSVEISFCPLCAGKLESGDDEQFVCEDCESSFFIQVVGEGDEDEDERKRKTTRSKFSKVMLSLFDSLPEIISIHFYRLAHFE